MSIGLRAAAGALLVFTAVGAGVALRMGRADERGVDPLAHYDAAVVLFGGYGSHGGVSAETHRRVQHALALIASGRAGALGCVGGFRTDGGTPGAALACALAVRADVPPAAIVVSPRSFDTWSNLREVRTMAVERDWRSVALVSSPPHLGRVAGMLSGTPASVTIGLLPYAYEDADPPISGYGVVGQVLYDRAARLLNAVLSPEQMTALAQRLRL